MGVLAALAEAVGAPEAALRLLAGVFLGYPAAWLTRCFPSLRSPVGLASLGLALGLFNFGMGVGHALLAVLVSHLLLTLIGPSLLCVQLTFAFHMTYLLTGYWYTGTESYDIKWTMPHCVLVLRLIGLSFDLWDGTKPEKSLSASTKITALRRNPTLIETAAHVFFPAGFLVGPQFSMVRLLDYIDGKYENVKGPSCITTGLKRGAMGLAYLAFHQIGTMYIPDSYFLTEEYDSLSFVRKHIILGLWSKITLAKYISCWLLTEGACISFGLAYNGENEKKESQWNGCRNVEVGIYEGCTKFGHYIDSFNINTNTWSAQYIYKRAAFLGSRQASQGITLVFLALWHGFHSGYYITFFFEFAIMLMEKQLESMLDKSQLYVKVSNTSLFKAISFVVLKVYVTVFMGYALIPFTLLKFSKWWHVYQSLYFSGFILFFPWMFVYKPLVGLLIKSTNTKPKVAKD